MSAQYLQATRALAVTPDDDDNIPFPGEYDPVSSKPIGINNGCLLYVGTSGSLKVLTIGNDEVTFTSFSGFLPVQVLKVFATGTTASGIIALW